MFKLMILVVVIFLSSCTTTYYVVRHAEKETTNTMTNDVPLSVAGRERAEALRDKLRNKNIQHIFSTRYIRTMATAAPLSQATGIPIIPYDYNPVDTAAPFIIQLKSIKKGNVLIVGHSNTIDDIMNDLTGEKKFNDLPDSLYGVLYILKRKGNHISFAGSDRFGNPLSVH